MDAMVAIAKNDDAVDGPWALPDGWCWTPLGKLGTWTGGGTPSKANMAFWTNGNVPWVSPKDMKVAVIGETEDKITAEAVEGSSAKYIPGGSVLMVMRSGILRHSFPVAVTDRIVTLNQDLRALTPHKGISPSYLARYLALAANRVLNDCSKDGTTVNSIEVSALERVLVPLAPIAEQRCIVARLDTLFAEIAEGEAALAEARKGLDTFRRVLLKAAVTGELTKDWRDRNLVTETGHDLLARITKIRASKIRSKVRGRRDADAPPLDISALAKLPAGWAWARWRDVGQSQNGRPFPSGDYAGFGVRLLRPGNLFADGRVRWSAKNTRFLPEKFAESNTDLIIHGGELVINLTAQSLKDEFLGRVCITDTDEYCLLNQRLGRLTPIEIDRNYMLLVFKSSLFRTFVVGLNSGSLIQHMFTSQIENFCFPVPPPAETAEILRRVSDALAATDVTLSMLDEEVSEAARLKQSILKAAFEGRLVQEPAGADSASESLARLTASPSVTSVKRGRVRKSVR